MRLFNLFILLLFESFTWDFAGVLHQELTDLLNKTFTQPFPHAVFLCGFERIRPIIKRNCLWNSGLIINIEDVIVFACIEVLIAGVIFRLRHTTSSLLASFGDNFPNFDPLCVLPHEGFWSAAIFEDPDLPFFLTPHILHLLGCWQLFNFLCAHP